MSDELALAVVEELVAVGVDHAAALATVAPHIVPFLGPIPSITLGVINHIVNRQNRDAARMFARVVRQLADEKGITAEEAAGMLEAKLRENPQLAEVAAEALTNCVDSIHEDAKLAFAVLAADYIASGAVRDRFFRGAGRLLRDADRAALSDLRKVLDGALSAERARGVDVVRLAGRNYKAIKTDNGDTKVVPNPWEVDVLDGRRHFEDEKDELLAEPIAGLIDVEFIFERLIEHSLATRARSALLGEGRPEIRMERPTMERLLHLLRLGEVPGY